MAFVSTQVGCLSSLSVRVRWPASGCPFMFRSVLLLGYLAGSVFGFAHLSLVMHGLVLFRR